MLKHIVSCLLLFFISTTSFAQVVFEVKVNRSKIAPDDVIEIYFVSNVNGSISLPNFDGFQIYGGPNRFHNSSNINGKVTTESGISFVLSPKKNGTITIESAQLEYQGKKYQTQPIRIEVSEKYQNQQPRQQSPQNRHQQLYQQMQQQMHQQMQRHQQMMQQFDELFEQRQRPQFRIPQDAGRGVHIETKVSKNSAYVNEPIYIEYILHVSYFSSANDIEFEQAPVFKDFWNYTEDNRNPPIEERTYNGKKYRSIVLKKAVLMPQKEGTLEIQPVKMRMIQEDFTDSFDAFGRPQMDRKRVTIASQPVKIQSKALPVANQPVNFSGAVGSFDLSQTIDKTIHKAGEAMTFSITLKGKGNLDLIQLPTLKSVEHLEIYEPTIKDNFSKNIQNGLEGSRTYTYTIVPAYKGDYTIEPIEFSYFDLASQSYKILKTNEINLKITEGDTPPIESDLDEKELDTTVVQSIKKQFDTNKGRLGWAKSKSFDWLFFIPLVAIPMLFIGKKYSKKIDFLPKENQSKLAKKYLFQAKAQIENPTEFYFTLEKCLHNYLKGKYQLEIKDLTSEKIALLLQEKNVSEEIISQFIQLKETCEMARYALVDHQNTENDYQLAVETIQNLDKQLKK